MTTPITDAELDAMEARAAAAPDEPWYAEQFPGGWDICDGDRGKEPGWLASCGHVTGEEVATFCAHARTDLPRLVAEVRRLRQIQARLLYGLVPLEALSEHLAATGQDDFRWDGTNASMIGEALRRLPLVEIYRARLDTPPVACHNPPPARRAVEGSNGEKDQPVGGSEDA